MFKIGDYVVNSSNGICKVVDIFHPEFDMANSTMEYYLIIPEEDKNTKLYIPIDGKSHGLRSIISKEEAWEIIDSIAGIAETVIEDDRKRENAYKDVIKSCEPEQLIGMIKNLHLRMQKREEEGKKNPAVDERYFRIAEDNLHNELAFAIGEDKNQIPKIIADRIERGKLD